MVLTMNDNPIIFAMANPDPEISPKDAFEARQDIIMATGRTDYPNQVNNVLGFPFIFRGALDVAATEINEEMKVAASLALAKLAKLGASKDIAKRHNREELVYGKDYIVPSPFDPRVLVWESYAVAKAAIETGVARLKINLNEYKSKLENGWSRHKILMNKKIFFLFLFFLLSTLNLQSAQLTEESSLFLNSLKGDVKEAYDYAVKNPEILSNFLVIVNCEN